MLAAGALEMYRVSGIVGWQQAMHECRVSSFFEPIGLFSVSAIAFFGVAWLVIVAAEMLTGGVGLGFWVWDEWNNLNVAHIIIAIFVVGLVGLLLEQLLLLMASRLRTE